MSDSPLNDDIRSRTPDVVERQEQRARDLVELERTAAEQRQQAENEYRRGIAAHEAGDNRQAAQWLCKAAAKGQAEATEFLELLDHYSCPSNKGWSQLVSELGYDEAAYRVGLDCKYSVDIARQWFELAAAYGHPLAQFELGCLYRDGEDKDTAPEIVLADTVWQDYVKAVEWFEKAAAHGLVEAMYELSRLYRTGEAGQQDNTKAKEWLEKVAATGHLKAKYELGCMYREGVGTPQDHSKAQEWLVKAAEQGHTQAAYDLGCRYRDGEGVKRDYAAARAWFKSASGYDPAITEFRRLNRSYARLRFITVSALSLSLHIAFSLITYGALAITGWLGIGVGGAASGALGCVWVTWIYMLWCYDLRVRPTLRECLVLTIVMSGVGAVLGALGIAGLSLAFQSRIAVSGTGILAVVLIAVALPHLDSGFGWQLSWYGWEDGRPYLSLDRQWLDNYLECIPVLCDWWTFRFFINDIWNDYPTFIPALSGLFGLVAATGTCITLCCMGDVSPLLWTIVVGIAASVLWPVVILAITVVFAVIAAFVLAVARVLRD